MRGEGARKRGVFANWRGSVMSPAQQNLQKKILVRKKGGVGEEEPRV